MSETLLGGRVQVRQPAQGFRGGHDAVFLAAAVPGGGASVLELGAGSGTASLCLAARRPDLAITGVEINSGLVELAQANAAANSMDQVSFHRADVFVLPSALKRDFDHVICNPPFHGPGTGSPDPVRQAALADEGKLQDWLKVGLQRTVSGGVFTVILRADRLPEALAVLPPAGLTLFPMWPKPGMPAGRILVQAVKGSGASARLLPGLILHRADGSHSDESEAVLRHGAALALQNPHL